MKKTSKQKRCDEFYKTHWPQAPEEPGDNELSCLKSQWEPHISSDSELVTLLFPPVKNGGLINQDVVLPALSELTTQLEGPYAIHHSDFLLRWSIHALCLRETSTGNSSLILFCL